MPINLHKEDKNKIRENLTSFMEDAPIKKSIFANNWKPQLPSLKLNLQFMPTKVISLVLLFAVLFGGATTAYASEDSLPGDTLYPVKGMTEGMRGWMKFSNESKAEWNAKLVEKRLAELEQLLEDGKITEEQKNLIEEKINEHTANAEARINKMKEKGHIPPAFNVAARLENALHAHEKNLEKWQEKFADKAEENAKFAEKLGERADKFEAMRIKFEAKIANQNGEKAQFAAYGKQKALENKIAEVEQFINKAKEVLGEEAVAEAEAKLQEAKTALEDGKTKIEEEKYGEAFLIFHEAHRTAQEAKIMVASQMEDESDEDSDTTEDSIISKIKKGKGKAFGFFKDKPAEDDDEENDDEDDGDSSEESEE